MNGEEKTVAFVVACLTIVVILIAVLCAKDCTHNDEMRARCVEHGAAPESCKALFKAGG